MDRFINKRRNQYSVNQGTLTITNKVQPASDVFFSLFFFFSVGIVVVVVVLVTVIVVFFEEFVSMI